MIVGHISPANDQDRSLVVHLCCVVDPVLIMNQGREHLI